MRSISRWLLACSSITRVSRLIGQVACAPLSCRPGGSIQGWCEDPDVRFERDDDGTLIVSVRRLEGVALLRRSQNDLARRLWVSKTDLRVKVFTSFEVTLPSLQQVDVRSALFGGG